MPMLKPVSKPSQLIRRPDHDASGDDVQMMYELSKSFTVGNPSQELPLVLPLALRFRSKLNRFGTANNRTKEVSLKCDIIEQEKKWGGLKTVNSEREQEQQTRPKRLLHDLIITTSPQTQSRLCLDVIVPVKEQLDES